MNNTNNTMFCTTDQSLFISLFNYRLNGVINNLIGSRNGIEINTLQS